MPLNRKKKKKKKKKLRECRAKQTEIKKCTNIRKKRRRERRRKQGATVRFRRVPRPLIGSDASDKGRKKLL